MRPLLTLACCLAVCGPCLAKEKKNKPLPSALPAPSKSVTELTEAARPSIVTITQIGRGEMREALGTGFVISADGLIATNLHVIGHARRLQVQFSDGKTEEVTAVHATDPNVDLAILRVKPSDLKPLPLGDSDAIKQGQPVIALGHPQGMKFSVVQGVVSALREVDRSRMIQIAIPIEEGNSGGPVLDIEGRVQGVVTLKSAITENLGFAHPVNDLKRLVAKPNPVPMERWLTIGRLDPKSWETVLGGRWTQHAGVVHVEDPGEGFGGRALCLSKNAPPGAAFEVEAVVKLDSEAGAAGLVFCSDGKDQHYGFYPSGGKLRLTRFNGPDVFSWTILADTPCAAYKPGDWNTLRVRVDAGKIECFVNDKPAITSDDDALRGGRVGICKFRTTRADFKGFCAGDTVVKNTVPSALAASLRKELDHFLEKPAERDRAVTALSAQPAAARSVLEDRARLLEEQAATLRRLQQDVHRQAIARDLAALLRKPADQTELLRAALLISKHDNPELDVDSYVCVVERMADELKADPAIRRGGGEAARRLSKFLFEESGFHGSRGDEIGNPSNSYLNEVLDDREGIPITLSIVYLDLARRLGLKNIHGLSLPGRFMIGCEEEKDGGTTLTVIDAFGGGNILTREQASSMVFEGTNLADEERFFEPASPRAVILRMLTNLASFARKPEAAIAYLDLHLAIDPKAAAQRLNRALMQLRARNTDAAKKDLEHLLDARPKDLDVDKIEQLYRSL
jgi:S1-C subfamily serine protease/regulator of sirC expression with transglutaminase-like and TPR domain